MGKHHLHIAFIKEGSKLFPVPGLGISAVLHVFMEDVHSIRGPASAQFGMSVQDADSLVMPHYEPIKLSVSMIMHLDGSFIMLQTFITPPSARRIHPQLLLRNGSVQVWDWSLPTGQNIRPLDSNKTFERSFWCFGEAKTAVHSFDMLRSQHGIYEPSQLSYCWRNDSAC